MIVQELHHHTEEMHECNQSLQISQQSFEFVAGNYHKLNLKNDFLYVNWEELLVSTTFYSYFNLTSLDYSETGFPIKIPDSYMGDVGFCF